jgi:hypothetical protein
MKPLHSTFVTLILLGTGLQAASVSGVSGRTLFENYRDTYGGNFIDFTMGVAPMPADRRLDNEFATTLGVTFSTFQSPSFNPLGPHNVYVSNFSGRQNTIVGTPCTSCTDDGRYPYQIEFTNPQRYAGVQRLWNADTRTRFYAPDGTLLFEGLGSDFYGYQADSGDTTTWVQRIEISGINQQVGYTDDLIFGTTVPEPGVISLAAASMAMLALRRRGLR